VKGPQRLSHQEFFVLYVAQGSNFFHAMPNVQERLKTFSEAIYEQLGFPIMYLLLHNR
jgi:hypothetical protein